MSRFTGTRPLLSLALRRDRVRLPIWIVVLGFLPSTFAASFTRLYPDVASRTRYGEGINANPATVALYGRALDPGSVGGLTAMRVGAIGAALVALMSVLTVVRHSRADEESGRRELVGSAAVGRSAPLAAALLVAAAADLLIGLLVILGLTGRGLPTGGAVALGTGLAGGGLVFAGIGAVTAQLSETARTATGLSLVGLGLAYVLRAAGDAGQESGGGWLHWLSPIGWEQQLRPFADERWWPLLLLAVAAAGLLGVASALDARRDLGAGLLAVRAGRPTAAPGLRSPLALVWRLQRGPLAAWAAGFALLGLIMGSAAKGVGDLVDDSPGVRDALLRLGGKHGIVDSYLAALFSVLGLLASAYAVSVALRMRTEEAEGRLEPLLSTPVSRVRWAAGHLVLAAAGSAALMLTAGLTAGLVHGLRTGDLGGQLPRLVGGALVQLPAVWVLAGVAVLLFGVAPRLAVASWAALAVALVLGQLGAGLQLAQWAMDISPFTHVPRLPGGPVSALPLVVLLAVAALLTASGLSGFRRRDVTS